MLPVQSLPFEIPKRQSAPKVWLSERDCEILEFLLEMKFASLEEIFSKFFKSSITMWRRRIRFGQESDFFN